jgi:uncharacterized membrane protein YjgN (DUF898 family)
MIWVYRIIAALIGMIVASSCAVGITAIFAQILDWYLKRCLGQDPGAHCVGLYSDLTINVLVPAAMLIGVLAGITTSILWFRRFWRRRVLRTWVREL